MCGWLCLWVSVGGGEGGGESGAACAFSVLLCVVLDGSRGLSGCGVAWDLLLYRLG